MEAKQRVPAPRGGQCIASAATASVAGELCCRGRLKNHRIALAGAGIRGMWDEDGFHQLPKGERCWRG
jgi:hypothetical protein